MCERSETNQFKFIFPLLFRRFQHFRYFSIEILFFFLKLASYELYLYKHLIYKHTIGNTYHDGILIF